MILQDDPVIRDLEQFGLLEAKIVYHCKHCGEDICMGDWYYNVCGDIYCEDCIEKEIAGFEE